MAPAALEVSLTAAGQAQAQREQVDRIWRQRLERADFAAGRRRSLREFGPGSGQDHRDRGQRHGPPTGQPGLDVDADLHRFLAEHAALAVSGCSSRPRVLEREGERDLT